MTIASRLLPVALVALAIGGAIPAAAAPPRPILVGFEDEPSFLWSHDRFAMLERASAAHASLVRVIAEWHLIAPTRPRNPSSPADPAYHFEGLDDLTFHSELRGIRVLLTVWGTPRWATRSHKVNAAPSPADLGAFCAALATRYSGRFRGQPFVGLYSVWNEPNLNQFLTPQFDANGRSVAPQLYAAMFRACDTSIKRANPRAKVGIGETAPRGHDAPRGRVQASQSPGRFAEALARIRPRLQFDAWSHHPYPPGFRGSPTTSLRWPNVAVGNLGSFERRLRRLFGHSVPLWLTEFGYQTAPERRGALSYALQAQYLTRAFAASVAVPDVQMFVWYVFRDTPGQRWQSGLLRSNNVAKPSYAAFSALASRYDVENPTLVIPPAANPVVRLSVVDFKADQLPGDPPLGMTYRVYLSRTGQLVADAQPRASLDVYGNISVTLRFTPLPGARYTVTFDLNDIHGHVALRKAHLIVAARR